jgi:hypothetical protein
MARLAIQEIPAAWTGGSLFPRQWMSSKETSMTDGVLTIKDGQEAEKEKKA